MSESTGIDLHGLCRCRSLKGAKMEESYRDFLVRDLAAAENALFELRNAYMGTGAEGERKARRIERMRRDIVDMLIHEDRALKSTRRA